jgi:hypothetical protein
VARARGQFPSTATTAVGSDAVWVRIA